jgi:hypothetical protein
MTSSSTSAADSLKQFFAAVDSRFEVIGDYLNPILVKETRQSIKSRQFAVTFVILLVACWFITIVGVMNIGPGIYYSASGGVMLMFYYYVLLFPLAVVVPFTAFRSLLTEKEDNTYDLLTVTSLSPRRIINGKLASAVVQIGVYFSAIAPCIAFTYLLRGIDVVAIALMLAVALLGSLGLSMVGLVFAAAATKRYGQTLLSVAFVTMLLLVFMLSLGGATWFVEEGVQGLQEWRFWAIFLMMVTAYLCLFATSYFAAIALITFSSANRSTPLRWTLLLHQACWIGWTAFELIVQRSMNLGARFDVDTVSISFLLATIYWFVVGTLLSSELPVMSERVRRNLPQSLLARSTLSWLNPGSATGYGLMLACLTSLLVLASGVVLIGCDFDFGNQQLLLALSAMWLAWGYAIAYVGLGRLFVNWLRGFTTIALLPGFMISLLLVVFGTIIPLLVQGSSRTWQGVGYTWLQTTNPFWSVMEILDRQSIDIAVWLLPLVLGVAACVLLLNLPAMAREVGRTRLGLPQRVVQDEAELHPIEVAATSPWDSRDATAEVNFTVHD